MAPMGVDDFDEVVDAAGVAVPDVDDVALDPEADALAKLVAADALLRVLLRELLVTSEASREWSMA